MAIEHGDSNPALELLLRPDPKKSALLAALFGVALAAIGLWRTYGSDSPGDPHQMDSRRHPGESLDVLRSDTSTRPEDQGEGQATSIGEISPSTIRGERTAPDAAPTYRLLVVHDSEDIPINGAVVTLHGSLDDLLEHGLETLVGFPIITDSAGSILLDDSSPSPEAEVATWITHPGFLAKCLIQTIQDGTAPVQLAPSEGLSVAVLDVEGRGVRDAEIVETALLPDTALALRRVAPAFSSRKPTNELLTDYVRKFKSGDDGQAAAHPCEFPIVLQARSGNAVSRPSIVKPGATSIELVLAASTKALGTIHLPAGFERHGEVRIDAFQRPRGALGESGIVHLGTASLSDDGSWGPLDLAANKEMDLIFRLRGGGLVADERVLEPRSSTPPFVVDFDASRGLSLRAYVFESIDGERRGIENARVEYTWRDPELDKVRRAASWTDVDGLAKIEGCAETTGAVRVSAPGFIGKRIVTVPTPRSVRLDVELVSGGILEGRCLSAGRPVEEFDILLWKSSPGTHSVHVFRHREDGTFRIDGAPIGAVKVVAVPAGLPESPIQRVVVTNDPIANLVINIPGPIIGRGRVVDALSGEGISGARIVPLVSVAHIGIEGRGTSYPVSSDGTFELEEFPPKNSLILVEAEGYARQRADGGYTPGEGIVFGDIPLSKTGTLTIRVLCDRQLREGELWVNSDGTHAIPFHAVPPDGFLEIEGVEPGHHDLHLVWQDGCGITRRINLLPGLPWIEEYELSTDESVTVDIVTPDGFELPAKGGFFATYLDSHDDMLIRTWELPPDGRVELRDCAADELWLEIVSPNLELLGFKHVKFQPGETRHTVMEISDRSLVLHAVDVDGNALADVGVLLNLVSESQPEATLQHVDANGATVFRGLAGDEAVLLASHPLHGYRTVRVDLEPEGATEVEVVLDQGFDLHLRIVDDVTVIPGAELRLFSHVPAITVALRHSDSEGLAHWAKLSTGRYHVRVSHPSLWTSQQELDFDGDSEPIEVSVRRLGNLEVRVVDPEGSAQPSIELALSSVEFGQSVASWVEQHRVFAAPANLRTNAQGLVQVKGIPHGTYLLEFSSLSGELIQQTIIVPPMDTLRHLISLD